MINKLGTHCSRSRIWLLRSAGFWLLIVALVAASASAQSAPQAVSQAIWTGTVKNTAGVPIAGAKVRLSSHANKAEATTNAEGEFHLPGLPAGEYHLAVDAQGNKAEYAQPLDLQPTAPPVALTLSIHGEILVATQSESSKAATGGEQLSSQAVSELPLNKRDFSSLLLLAAGTMTDANGATNFTAQFAINGQRGVEATFAMDGADISDPEMGGSTFSNFNVDAVEEIRLQFRLDARRDRPRRLRLHQHHHALGRQRISRLVLRVRAQFGLRCAQLLRPCDARVSGAHSAFPPQRIRLHQRRPGLHSARV